VKTVCWIKSFLAVAALAVSSVYAEEWRQVAFIGTANVFDLSGVVEVIQPRKTETRVLKAGDRAKAGEVLKIWQGAEVVLKMEGSGSLVRAKGPVLLRLAPEKEGYDRASLTGAEERVGFVARAVRGKGEYQQNGKWRALRTGDVIPDGTRVRAAAGASMDFYHNGIGTVVRISELAETLLVSRPTVGGQSVVASKAP
jgi:hypothetical protein